MKALIISGLLDNTSDNIIPLLNKETDIFVHTWDLGDNSRWITKLNRYKKYCRDLKVIVDKPVFDKKLYSYFYSTYKAFSFIKDVSSYRSIIKFKPDLEGNIDYAGNIDYYFEKGYLQSRPLLRIEDKESSIFGSIYYKTLDERFFTAYPLALKKAFDILEEEFIQQMYFLDNVLTSKYGENYEGSIFWTEWFERRGIKIIQDLDLKLPNNKASIYGH